MPVMPIDGIGITGIIGGTSKTLRHISRNTTILTILSDWLERPCVAALIYTGPPQQPSR